MSSLISYLYQGTINIYDYVISLFYDDGFGSYTNKLTIRQQKAYWEKHNRHLIGVACACNNCGEGSMSFCRCKKIKLFNSLTDQQVKTFLTDLNTYCDKCGFDKVFCDCEYENQIREFKLNYIR